VYLPVSPQPDCASAWLAAAHAVDGEPGHHAHNVIIDVADPTARASLVDPVVAQVNDFLLARDKSIECIANTIFPQSLYWRHKHPTFIDVFHKRVLPKVRNNKNWSGYYFERMTALPQASGKPVDQLSRMIERMNDPANTSLNKHEVELFDASRDVTGSPYGGQCLSFLSFHLAPGSPKTLLLTAQYRNHYYVEKLLGNLIGLGRLMAFIAKETDTKVGSLTIISTNAEIDLPKVNGKASRKDFTDLLVACENAPPAIQSAA
jgi:hypothetical protein